MVEDGFVFHAYPSSGPKEGGTVVGISGSNLILGSGSGCLFGKNRVDGTVSSSSLITCISPPFLVSVQQVAVQIINADSGASIGHASFTYLPQPEIDALSVSS